MYLYKYPNTTVRVARRYVMYTIMAGLFQKKKTDVVRLVKTKQKTKKRTVVKSQDLPLGIAYLSIFLRLKYSFCLYQIHELRAKFRLDVEKNNLTNKCAVWEIIEKHLIITFGSKAKAEDYP